MKMSIQQQANFATELFKHLILLCPDVPLIDIRVRSDSVFICPPEVGEAAVKDPLCREIIEWLLP